MNLRQTRNYRMKITISTDPSSYGETTENEISIVQSRMESIITDLGHESVEEEFDGQVRYDDDDEAGEAAELGERIFELAMECSDIRENDPAELRAAVEKARNEYPFPVAG